MKLHALLLIAAVLCSSAAYGSGQIADEIEVAGRIFPLYSDPLRPLLDQHETRGLLMPFVSSFHCSASYRGYRSRWQLARGQLIFVSILVDPCLDESKEIPATRLLPNTNGPIVATWYSGDIYIGVEQLLCGRCEFYIMMDESCSIVSIFNGAIRAQIYPELGK